MKRGIDFLRICFHFFTFNHGLKCMCIWIGSEFQELGYDLLFSIAVRILGDFWLGLAGFTTYLS